MHKTQEAYLNAKAARTAIFAGATEPDPNERVKLAALVADAEKCLLAWAMDRVLRHLPDPIEDKRIVVEATSRAMWDYPLRKQLIDLAMRLEA